MDNTMAVSQPVETQMNAPIKTLGVPEISLDPMDFQKELAKIAAEQGLTVDKTSGNAVPVGTPVNTAIQTQPQVINAVQAITQPATTQAVTQPIPDKFKTSEGQPDVVKIEKSYMHAEEALKRYQDKESELRRKQAEVQKLQTQQYVPQQNGYVPPQTQNNGQFSPAYINERLNALKDPGAVIYEAANLAYIQATADAETKFGAQVQNLQARLEGQDRNRELERIAKDDPWVMSQEGIDVLSQLRAEFPHLNQSPTPWAEAYDKHLAIRSRQGFVASGTTHLPQAQTVKAPPSPVNANASTPSFNLGRIAENKSDLNSFLNSLPNDAARAAFWANALPGANKGV